MTHETMTHRAATHGSTTHRIIVIGSGIAGASTAFALARRGAQVTIVESGHDGQATAASAGILQPWSSRADGPFYELYARGAAYYDTLIPDLAELGIHHTGYRKTGSLVVSSDPAGLDEVERRVRQRAIDTPSVGAITRLDAATARELFPPLAPGLAGLHIAGGARVDGRVLRSALLEGAARLGAVSVAGTARVQRAGDGSVEALLNGEGTGDGSVVTLVNGEGTGGGSVVTLGNGDRLEADAVVVAAGAWSSGLLGSLGLRLPIEPQRGQITHLRLSGVDTSAWPSVLPLDSHYLVAFDDSRIAVGATRETGSGFDARVTAGGQLRVLQDALRLAPGLADATVIETRVGLRPLSASGRPVIGAVKHAPGLFVNAGFGAAGLTMGPQVGELLADLILSGNADAGLAPFAPEE